jgi:uncharacterized membrane protein YdcZ (DUF606 family)
LTGLLLLLFAVIAGSFLPLQAGVNARLAQFVGGPVRASLISFFVGTLCLALVAAQLVMSVLADQFGWIAFEQRSVTPLRLVGVGLLVTGALLVRLF